MNEVQQHSADAISGVSALSFDWAAFRAACRKRGATTVPACAALTGIPERTLYYLRRNPASTSLVHALRLAEATDLTLHELFAPQHQEAA